MEASTREEPTAHRLAVTHVELIESAREDARAEAEAILAAERRVKGAISGLLVVLGSRGIDVPGEARVRIRRCADIGQALVWIGRAATASTIDDVDVVDVFGDAASRQVSPSPGGRAGP